MWLALAIVARSGGGARLCPYQEINHHGLIRRPRPVATLLPVATRAFAAPAPSSTDHQNIEEAAKRAIVAAQRSLRRRLVDVRVETRPVDGPACFAAELA
jgi:hypothetical protein